MPDQRLLLIDGLNVAYRAFFAIPNLTTSQGQPTNAVFGFIRMTRQLRQQWQPHGWAVVFDGGLPAHRLQALPEYKAQRPPMPDALRSQLETINEYLQCAGICAIRMEAQEADDVIASIANQAQASEVLIATSDKDALQLVDARVNVVSPMRAGDRLGPPEVMAKCGVPADRIVEWLALAGDAVDNIPGVPGVGAKTAARLLSQFGHLAAMWENLDQVTPERLRLSLAANRAAVERNLLIVRLARDLPCAFDWEKMAVRPESSAKLRPFYEALEFHALARELREEQLLL